MFRPKSHNMFIIITITGIALGSLLLNMALAVKLPGKQPPGPVYIPDKVIVKYKKDVNEIKKTNLLSKISAKEIRRLKHLDLNVIQPNSPSADLDALIEELNRDPSVEYAEKIPMTYLQLTPPDPDFDNQWPLNNTGQSGGTSDADIDAAEAWDDEDGSSNTIVVAVIDSGIDYTHPDLMDNIFTNPGEDAWSDPLDPTTGNGIDDDGNGKVDDWKGWDFVGAEVFFTPPDNDPKDMNGHGTHVSGIIGAASNTAGGVGVNFHAKILPIKIGADDILLNSLMALEAIDYIIDLKIRPTNGVPNLRIINASWSQAAPLGALKDAIETAGNAGILFVAAAGNGGLDGTGDDIDHPPLLSGSWPAAFDSKSIITIAATDHNDLLADFSNFGATHVDLAAPGVYYYSTMPTYEVFLNNPDYGFSQNYDYLSGTSMATPCVAGAASLLFAADPTLTVCEAKSLLMEYVDSNTGLQGLTLTGGRLNLAAAIQGTVVDSDGDGTPDVCDDDSDNDGCNDIIDIDPFTFSSDGDSDSFGSDCDCDDSDDQVNPGMEEIPGNGKDDDCNSRTPPWGSAASMTGMKDSHQSDIMNHLFLIIVPIGTLILWKCRRQKRRSRK